MQDDSEAEKIAAERRELDERYCREFEQRLMQKELFPGSKWSFFNLANTKSPFSERQHGVGYRKP